MNGSSPGALGIPELRSPAAMDFQSEKCQPDNFIFIMVWMVSFLPFTIDY
jgi:hypothetical protein